MDVSSELKILILEDNPFDAELIEFALKEAGLNYSSKIVSNRKDFQEALETFRPGLILSDYQLPSFTGADALKMRNEKCPDVPFILVTGAVGEEIAIETLTSGATDYVLKNKMQRFIPAINRALTEIDELAERRKVEVQRDNLVKELEGRLLELKENKDLLDAILETQVVSLSVFTAVRDEAGDIVDLEFTYANNNAKKIAGGTELEGKRYSTVFPGIKESGILGHLINVIETGQTLDTEFHYRDGEIERFFRCKAAPFLDGVVVNAEDITKRKLADQASELSETQRRTMLERNRLQSVLEATQAAVVLIDVPARRFSYLNRRAVEIYGENYSGSDLKTQIGRIKALKTDGSVYRFEEMPAVRTMNTGETIRNEEMLIQRTDGEWLTLLASSAPIYATGGNIASVVLSFHDITERKRLESYVAFLSELNRQLADAETTENLIAATAGSIGAFFNAEACSYYEIDEGRDEILMLYRWQAGREPCINRRFVMSQYFSDRFSQANREKNLVAVTDTETDDRTSSHAGAYREIGIRSIMIVPFHVRGEWKYSLSIIDSKEREWKPYEKDLFREIAGRFFPRYERLRIEAALAESEERYRLIYENSLSGILFTKADTHMVLSANAAAQKILGMSEEEIIESAKREIFNGDDRFKDIIEEREKTGSASGEIALQRKNAVVEYTTSVFRDRKGNEYASIIFQDITWRKQAEKILKESEERFREMADAMPQLVWTVTGDGNVVDYINRRKDELDGIVHTEGAGWNAFAALHPDDIRKTTSAWIEALKTKSENKVEHRLKTKEGPYRWYLSRTTPIKVGEEGIVKWIGTTTDIHDTKEAEENLKERSRQLENTNRELETFAYSVSHDLRAPLRAIEGFSRMLMKKKEILDEEAKSRIEVIRNNVKKMDSLIEDLLNFSRYVSVALSMNKIDMNEVVDEVSRMHLQSVGDRAIDLKIEAMPQAVGDVKLVEQVWSNLLANAIKFTRSRRIAVIEIGGKKEGRMNVYYVRDNGAGFDMKYYDRLFTVFQRLHGQDEYEGTGVGLPIVQRIVSRHGGRVWAESKEGKGATFYFTLPADP